MWQGIIGHDDVVERFRLILASGRLASTYLFVGRPGIGKRRFALELAHSLLCTTSPEAALAPCGECESCRLFASGSHPDLDVVGIRPDKSELIIGQFIGDDKNPKEDALCHRLSLRPFFGGRRVAIVDDADHFNENSANCLLKTLEEPPPDSLLILIGTSPARQLPTIRSRSQLVRFKPLDTETITQILLDQGLLADRQQAHRAAELGGGSVELALQLADPELWQFRQQLQTQLMNAAFDHVRLGRAVQAFIEAAGKEPSQRRERLRTVIGFVADLYRERLRAGGADAEAALHVIDVSLEALEYVDRNVNQATLIAWWSSELAKSPVAVVADNT